MKDVITEYKSSSTELDMSEGSKITGEPMQLLSGIQGTGNDHLEDLQDEKAKLSSDSSQWRKRARLRMKLSALWPVMWETSENDANKVKKKKAAAIWMNIKAGLKWQKIENTQCFY